MTIDINELRRLAQAALAGPDGISLNWIKLLRDFQQKADPTTLLELLDRLEEAKTAWKEADKACRDLTEKVIPNLRESLEAAERERDKYKTAYNEWCEKSEWIQEGINNREISPKYLGWHLADIALDLLKEHKEKCDDLQAKVEQMERPSVPDFANTKDAARYRWLRENGLANEKRESRAVLPRSGKKASMAFRYWTTPEELDMTIDAMLAAMLAAPNERSESPEAKP